MIRRPPRSTLTDTLFPYTTLFRSLQRPRRQIIVIDRVRGDHRFIADAQLRHVVFGIIVQSCGIAILRKSDPFRRVSSVIPDFDLIEPAMASLDHVEIFEVGYVGHVERSEERRVGKECVSTCRSRWSPYH